jgi:hypothetical protein
MNTSDGNFYIKNREIQETGMKQDLDKISEGFTLASGQEKKGASGFKIPYGNNGPVLEKNIADFEVLNDLQTRYYKELQIYNQTIKDLVENSRGYVNASNMNNNKFHNKYVRDGKSVGYVTNQGVWKHLPNATTADSIQGKNSCPNNWRSSETEKPDEGQEYSIKNAPLGNIIKMGGQELIKGSNMIQNQSCQNAGQNVYVTEPSIPTSPQYLQCSKNKGSYQSDLGTTSFNICKQRAADEGSNVFSMGPNYGNSKGQCFIGGGGSRIVKNSVCSVAPGVGRMGKSVKSRQKGFKYIRGYTAYAIYQTENANNSNLGDTFHITDDLTKKKYPDHMIKQGTEFQMISGYGSRGNDITSGSGLSIEEIKQKCLDTPNSGGFAVKNGNYWIKNKNMWPRGKRHATPNTDLYIRIPSVLNDISCGNEVKSTRSNNIISYPSDGIMTPDTKCALGTIAKSHYKAINIQYQILISILDEIKQKIQELSRTDLILNQKLLSEYTTLENKLEKYEQVYKGIKREKTLMSGDSAFEEDTELNMLSYNKQYIIWSILALGVTFGVVKTMK